MLNVPLTQKLVTLQKLSMRTLMQVQKLVT